MSFNLVIVESPSKVKAIQKYLPSDFVVVASLGHVRELQKSHTIVQGNEVSVVYVVLPQAEKVVSKICKLWCNCKALYIATDLDKEGEAIGWHIEDIVTNHKPRRDIPILRVVFHEITKKSILSSFANARSLNMSLVDAQKARQSLDLIYGFEASALIRKKLPACRSTGRVQSPTLRLVCDRYVEKNQFVPREYWSVTVKLQHTNRNILDFDLFNIDGENITADGLSPELSSKICDVLNKTKSGVCSDVKNKSSTKKAPPPFTTAVLQQESSKQLGMSPSRTMRVAQQLYEGIATSDGVVGLITYMRTDSVHMNADYLAATRKFIIDRYGLQYCPKKDNVHKTSTRNAQEAHECIRPTDVQLVPSDLRTFLTDDQFILYKLIWERAIMSQMSEAKYESIVCDVEVDCEGIKCVFRSRVTKRVFHGWLVFAKNEEQNPDFGILTLIKVGDKFQINTVVPLQHFTTPPSLYTDAGLIKELESNGLGRPSTYAYCLEKIEGWNYVVQFNRRFTPTAVGMLTVAFLMHFLPKYVSTEFTADMERNLDKIASGDLGWQDVVRCFWEELHPIIGRVDKVSRKDILQQLSESMSQYFFCNKDTKCPQCNQGTLSIKCGKTTFLGCSQYPQCEYTESLLTSEEQNKVINLGIVDDVYELTIRYGMYGWYIQKHDMVNNVFKKVTIPQAVSVKSINLALAKFLSDLPIVLGKDTLTGNPISLMVTRFGYCLCSDNIFVSIPLAQIQMVNLSQAQEKIDKKRSSITETTLGVLKRNPVILKKSGRMYYLLYKGCKVRLYSGDMCEGTISFESACNLLDKRSVGSKSKKRTK